MSRKTAATGAPSSSSAAAIAASWFGPPSPKSAAGARVTVLSPPQPSITVPGANGAPSAALWRAMFASTLPIWRASPSRLVETTTGARPSAVASTAIASQAVVPVTRSTVWIASASRSGDSASAPCRCSRIVCGVASQSPWP